MTVAAKSGCPREIPPRLITQKRSGSTTTKFETVDIGRGGEGSVPLWKPKESGKRKTCERGFVSRKRCALILDWLKLTCICI